MVKYAIKRGIRFDYLLVDSWFPCTELLQFIHSRHFKCHLIGMIKMGKTKYETAIGNLCAPDIIKRLEKAKATKGKPFGIGIERRESIIVGSVQAILDVKRGGRADLICREGDVKEA